MFFKCCLFRHLEILHCNFFYHFEFFSQPLENLFLTVKRYIIGISIPQPPPRFSLLQPNIEKNRKECGDPNEVASDNDDDKDDDDDDDDDDDRISKDA